MTTIDAPESVVFQWPAQGDWTYADYARLPDSEWRYEVIGGDLRMIPAPNVKHQRFSLLLSVAIHLYVEELGLGQVFVAPIDVILGELATPVQPDILFIRTENLSIITPERIEGAPDLIVEILSPGSRRHDRQTKYRLYAEAGVREYWIAGPETCAVDVYALRGNAYVPFGRFRGQGDVRSELLPELRIPLGEICGR